MKFRAGAASKNANTSRLEGATKMSPKRTHIKK